MPDSSDPSGVESTLDDHRGCMELVSEVENCLDRRPEDPVRWLADLQARLHALAAELRSHFEREEAGPLFRNLPERHPRLADPLARLEAEHPIMLRDLETVLRKAAGLNEPEVFELRELNARVQLLVARIRRHEAAENELVFEAHWAEIGVGD